MSKWIWRGILAIVGTYLVVAGISRHIHMNRLAHDLRYGTHARQVAAAKELMVRDRLYDKVQEMPKKTRIAVMEAVQAVPGELTVKQSLILLKDTEPTVRARVTQILTLHGKYHIKVLVPAMKDSDENVRNGAKDSLVGIGSKVIPLVQPAVKEADLRVAACDVLVRIGEPSVLPLIELLTFPDQDVRMAVAASLGKIASKTATMDLLKATRDVQAVRRVAISSLCSICDPRSTDLLVEVLSQTRDDGEVRARSARALSVIGGPKAIATLTGALGDLDLKVRTSVISGLQRIGAPAVKPVMAAISSGSSDVRRAGAAVMERIDSPEAVPPLLQLARHADPKIRASAARGLGFQSTGTRADVLVSMLSDPQADVAKAAEDSLAHMEERAVPSLISVLKSASPDVAKYRASQALARIGSEAVPSLLATAGAGGEAAKWAAYALGRSRDPEARPALERLVSASDPDLARVARQALNRF